ncbi:hypothetical protein CYMTET_35671 [Cymbomonas tetramitiformis]|uniref:Uncharacterized protein n=1 Tax=Cymbomonas tetramitiformis TaxID=36881 RepID=A0AAE0KNR0_9CHLO|nr:hypothetical protein CYMTET_35671 [Cymbomonas tetramitiformis]
MSHIPSQNRFPAEVARTLGYLRNLALGEALRSEASATAAIELASPLEDRAGDDPAVCAWFRGESRWWRTDAPLRGAREFHERATTEHARLLEHRASAIGGDQQAASLHDATSLFPMLVAHDLLGEHTGQAKMYAVLSWARFLCYACASFRVRCDRTKGGFSATGVPSRSSGVRVTDRYVPTICFHNVRPENAPVHALMLDFDFPDPCVVDYAALFSVDDAEASVSRIAAAWSAVRSEVGPVCRAVRAIEAAWPRWCPGYTAHVLLFETRRDEASDPGKPSVHGYLFQRCANDSVEGESENEWSFEGPVFEDKKAHVRFFEEFLHPLLEGDSWYAERALRIESFLDPVNGSTARAIGMAKWEAGALSRGDPRYSRLGEPMRISDSLAVKNFVDHRTYAIGRMTGIFTDVPVPTVYWDETARLRVIGRREEMYASLLRGRSGLPHERTGSLCASSVRVPVTVADSEFAEVLRFAAASTLHALGVSSEITSSIEIDPRRVTVCTRAETTSVTVMAYQTRRCRFCVEREFEVGECGSLRIGGWSNVPRRLVARTGSSRTSEHTDGGKMYFVYRFDAQEGKNLLVHHCWKCMGRGQSDKRGRPVGTIPRQAVNVLRRMVDERLVDDGKHDSTAMEET